MTTKTWGETAMRRVAFAVAAAVTALALARVAHADPADYSGYMETLADAGIHANSDATLITTGKGICADIARGVPSVTEANRLRMANPTMSLVQGHVAVDVALTFLCDGLVNNNPDLLLPMQ